MLEILLISAGAVLETLFIMRSYKRRDVSSVVLKTAASVVFVLLGLLELRRMGPSVYEWYVVAGLTLGMLGDLLLALRFLSEKLHRLFFAAGSMSFFLGHIVYILAILTLGWKRRFICENCTGYRRSDQNHAALCPAGISLFLRRADSASASLYAKTD